MCLAKKADGDRRTEGWTGCEREGERTPREIPTHSQSERAPCGLRDLVRVLRIILGTTRSKMGYRVPAVVEFLARHDSEKFGRVGGPTGVARADGYEGGGVKGTREARGVFRASCRGVQQVIVFGIHLHASSFLSLSLSLWSLCLSFAIAILPPLFSSTTTPSVHPVALYVVLSTAFLSTGRRARYPPAGFIRLRFLAKIRAKGVSRGIPTVGDLPQ